MFRKILLSLSFLALTSGAHAVATTEGSGALLRGLDKVSGQSRDLEIAAGGQVEFGHLSVTMSECRYPRGSINSNAYAHLTIRDDRAEEALFDGWMVASSPALSALDHPRYDIWVIRCRSN